MASSMSITRRSTNILRRSQSTITTSQSLPYNESKNKKSLKRKEKAKQKAEIAAEHQKYATWLQSCTEIRLLTQLHAQIFLKGFNQNLFFASKLVAKYIMYNQIEISQRIYEEIKQKDGFLCNLMIRIYATNKKFEEAIMVYNEMVRLGIETGTYTFPFALKSYAAFRDTTKGQEIHGRILRIGVASDVFVCNSLIDFYGKCRKIELARQVFDEMPRRDSVSWGAMISGYIQSGCFEDAFSVFEGMRNENVKIESNTLASLVSACAKTGDLQRGEWIHEEFIGYDCLQDVYLGSSLIDMYARCGCVEYARQVFEKMPVRDVVIWNAMISGYVHNGFGSDALVLFDRMKGLDAKPNSISVLSALSACSQIGALQRGRRIHDYVRRNRFDSNVQVVNSLIAMYGKCGSIGDAQKLFDNMPNQQLESWNAMLAAYASAGGEIEALNRFKTMEERGVEPNLMTMKIVLPACGHLGALEHGKRIHNYLKNKRMEDDVFIGTSLVDMYGKCGCLENAKDVFDRMGFRNVVSWTSMISAYGSDGQGKEAARVFSEMIESGTSPNEVTFLAILSACSHAGLLNEGFGFFDSMNAKFGMVPNPKHYACIVDLLCRDQQLNEAYTFVTNMPIQPDVSVWRALLNGCRVYGDLKLAEVVADNVLRLDADVGKLCVLLERIYKMSERWYDLSNVQKRIKEKLTKPSPARTVIEIDHGIHSFSVGDRSHPQADKIYARLDLLLIQMQDAGYLPDTNLLLHDVPDEFDKQVLWCHGEKLALSFGLLNTNPGDPIRIMKNECLCVDCHNAFQIVSRLEKRDIILRDSTRFHRFSGGTCSCGGYW